MGGRWFRMDDDMINHPKVLRLSDGMFRAWVKLLCMASKNDGKLPSTADNVVMLRLKPARVAEWITALTAAGLFDNFDDAFVRTIGINPNSNRTRQPSG